MVTLNDSSRVTAALIEALTSVLPAPATPTTCTTEIQASHLTIYTELRMQHLCMIMYKNR